MTLLLQLTSDAQVARSIELRDVIAIAALLIGLVNMGITLYRSPKYQKKLEKEKEAASRRVNVFKTLMATRGAVLSYRHVEALNMIDLEFLDKEYAAVRTARDNYYDNLSHLADNEPSYVRTWSERNGSLLSALLFEMGKALNYTYSLVDIQRKVYTPVAHTEVEREEEEIRKGLVALLQDNKGQLSIRFEQDEQAVAAATIKQNQVQDLMIEYYSQKLKKNS